MCCSCYPLAVRNQAADAQHVPTRLRSVQQISDNSTVRAFR
jgi:hypothetical protein